MHRRTLLADPTTSPVPQINDAYWFGYSKNVIDSALKSRDDTADKLQTFVAWLWTIYTATAALGINFARLALDTWSTVLICSPIVTLIVVYWLTVWVRMPALLEFDPRSPEEIEAVYEHNLREKQTRLNSALAMAGIAAALVIAGLLRSAIVMSPAPRVEMDAAFAVEGSVTSVAFHGYIIGGKTGTLSVFSLPHVAGDAPLRIETFAIDQGRFALAPKAISGSTTKFRAEISSDLDPDTRLNILRNFQVPTLVPISSVVTK